MSTLGLSFSLQFLKSLFHPSTWGCIFWVWVHDARQQVLQLFCLQRRLPASNTYSTGLQNLHSSHNQGGSNPRTNQRGSIHSIRSSHSSHRRHSRRSLSIGLSHCIQSFLGKAFQFFLECTSGAKIIKKMEDLPCLTFFTYLFFFAIMNANFSSFATLHFEDASTG